MAKKIILATMGSLGDLHPFLAIGQALKARGARPVMAIPEDSVAKAEAAGLEAVAVVPSIKAMVDNTGLDLDRFMRRTFSDAPSVARTVLLPYFSEAFDRLDAIAADADLLASSNYMFAGPAVAEKHGLPYAAMLLQPLSLLSDYAPPLLWEYPVLFVAPRAGWQVMWNRAANFAMRVEVFRRYGFSLNRLRRARGVGPIGITPFFDVARNTSVTIGMYSSVIGGVQPDYPPNTHLVGFPHYDSESGHEEALPADLEAFLDAGAPPIVFTLGSFSIYGAGDFFVESREVARRLGRRAVMITGTSDAALDAPDCRTVRYARISQLFPRGAAIVHHGGIGTTGQALASGHPQLVVPHFGDHPDHAARVARLKVGLVLKRKRYTVERATAALGKLLGDAAYGERAARIGRQVAAEDAAAAAADILIDTVARAGKAG